MNIICLKTFAKILLFNVFIHKIENNKTKYELYIKGPLAIFNSTQNIQHKFLVFHKA